MPHDTPTSSDKREDSNILAANNKMQPVNAVRVLESLGITRYHRCVPRCGSPHLDLTQFHPQACSTLAEFAALNQLLPISLLKLDTASAMIGADPFFSSSPSYLEGVTFDKLQQLFTALPDTHHIFCSMVLAKCPVHLFFDLDLAPVAALKDAPSSPNRPVLEQVVTSRPVERVIDEFVLVLNEFFVSVYGRPADLSGMHWETACNPSKFSLHAHITTEAFVDVEQLKHFMKAFKAFIEERCIRGGDSCLCVQVPADDADKDIIDLDQQNVPSGEDVGFVHLLDFGIYTKNRSFRLIHCRKPTKAKLTFLPYHMPATGPLAAGTDPSPQELLFRSMPSYSIAVTPEQLLTYTPARPNPGEFRKSLGLPSHSATRLSSRIWPSVKPSKRSSSALSTGTLVRGCRQRQEG